MREELLEDIRDLELSARGCPLTGVLTILVLGNINGVVDEAHTIISRFVLKNITVHLAVVHDELNDLRRSIGDLDRVRLDVSNNKAPFLNLVLEVDHKQGSTLGDNIIFVAVVMERVLEAGRSQSVNGVDGDFQRLCQSIGGTLVRQILCQSAVQHLACLVKLFVLDSDTSIADLTKPLRIDRPKEIFCDDTGGMHRSNIQQGDVSVHTRLGIDIATLANFFAAISRLAFVELVTWEDWAVFLVKRRVVVILLRSKLERQVVHAANLAGIAHIAIVELILRMLVSAEDDLCGQSVRSVVDGHSSHIGQNLTSDEVGLTSIEHCLRSDDIVVAVFSDLLPHALRNRLIPRKTKLLVVDTEFDLPFFQALFLRAEVINISIRDIVGFAKEAVVALGFLLAANDPLRQVVKLLIGIAHQASVEDVVIVPPAVETDESELHQALDVFRGRVDHPNHRLCASRKLPVYEEKVWKHLNIIKDEVGGFILRRGGRIGRFERHLIDELDAILCLIGAVGGKGQDGIAHIGNIVNHAAFIRIRQNLVDKVDTGLSCRVNLFIEISLDLNPKPFLALNHLVVYHAAFSFQW